MGRLVFLVALTGCDLFFPLADPAPRDGTVADASMPDGFRPLVPPDGLTACSPSPAFETWTFAAHGLLGHLGDILSPTFISPDRVLFTKNGVLFESTVDGPPMEITELALPDGSGIRFPGSTPDGTMIWFNRFAANASPSVGNYYAIKNERGSWVAARADFGITALQLVTANVGYYAGTARMIVAIEPSAGDGLRLVELETIDGVAWQQLDTLPFSDGTSVGGDFGATIAADGCFVLFRREAKIFYSRRNDAGTFQPPIEVPQLANALDPAINPTSDRLWAIQGNVTILDGVPP